MRIIEFIKIMLQTFWTPKNKYLKWFNRSMTVIVSGVIIYFAFFMNKQQNASVQTVQKNYQFDDPGQKHFSSKYSQAEKNQKELKEKKSDLTQTDDVLKMNYNERVQMSENPNLDFVSPGYQTEMVIMKLSKTDVPKSEKNYLLRQVILTSGQLEYVYEKFLMQSFGINDVKATFDIYSGTLFYGSGISNIDEMKVNLISERAQEFFECSELSMRVKKLTIQKTE